MLAGTTSSLSANLTSAESSSLRLDDVFVFIALESLGTLAITGNICLIVVLLRNKYLHRASFILMLSLAIADVIHGVVTTSYFYPPILLKRNHMPPTGVRIFNILDWTAWSITLTHMTAICLDRLIAIMLYGRYNLIVTVKRIRFFTLFCWSTFLSINIIFIFALRACCLITPLANNHFYTFGYGEFESKEERQNSIFNGMNIFTFTYSPLEMTTLAILSISNPTTLIQLYRRHKRKIALRIQAPPSSHQTNSLKTRSQWQRASTMLLEMSMRMGSKHVNEDVRNLASRRANRQQQRILLQISVVACLFYSIQQNHVKLIPYRNFTNVLAISLGIAVLFMIWSLYIHVFQRCMVDWKEFYMVTYYLLYHVFDIENKWVVLFNSLFYSTTHMINPVIYFSLNKEMRVQLIKAWTDCLSAVCCIQMSSEDADSQRKASTEPRSSTKGVENSVTINETSPLFNANLNNNNNLRPALLISTSAGVEKLRIAEFGASLKRLVHHNNSTTITKISINSTTDEIVDSSAINEQTKDEFNLKELTNGFIPNGHKNNGFVDSNCHKNSGFIDSNEQNSSMSKLTDESEEETRLLVEEPGDNESQKSLMKSIVKAMHRIVVFDSKASSSRVPYSRSMDQIMKQTQRTIKSSRTIHAMSEYRQMNVEQFMSKSQSFNENMNEDVDILRDSLVLLINDSHNTITTVQELPPSKYSPTCTPEDEIIFL